MPETRAHRRARAQQAAGQPEIEGELGLPHAPMYVHLSSQEDSEDSCSTDEADRSGKKMDHDVEHPHHHTHSLKGDRSNIAILTFLYVLQGIPLGLAGSIPYLLQSRQISYKEQAVYSFVYWPFSVKLLWAPLVDSLYIPRFGRRKTWLVPVQYLLGIFMLILSSKVTDYLGEGESKVVRIHLLTFLFFMLNFLAATQDIVVDGWALTMLSRKNVGWASTCNTIGQTAGYFLGNVVFLALESPQFCNNYLRSEPQPVGIVTLSDFLYMWGFVFLITTTLVMLFKHEIADPDEDPDHGIISTYKLLWRIVRLKSVASLVLILLTCKIGFAAADAVTALKLIEEGVPKQKLALLGVPMIPIQIILPLIISKYTAGPKPLSVFIKALPFRLVLTLMFPLIVYWGPSTRLDDGDYPAYFFGVVLVAYALYQIALYSMFVAMMAFYAKISDPLIGGTYMTLLNTITNFGGNWPATIALWMIDPLTTKECQGAEGSCNSKQAIEACTEAGGQCVTTVDGYYIEVAICFVIGVLWILWRSRKVKQLQNLPVQAWTCP